MRHGWTRHAVYTVLVLVLAGFPALTGGSYYLLHLATMAGIMGIVTLGLNILMGNTGLVSLGQAGFFAIGAYAVGILTTYQAVSFGAALLLGTAAAVVAGLLIGLTSVKLHGGYLALVTVGFGRIVQLWLVNETQLTGGSEGLLGIPPLTLGSLSIKSPTGFYYLVLGATVLILAFTRNVLSGRFGRALLAVREDATAARMIGINPTACRLAAFALSSAYAGLAGGIYAEFAGSLFPDYFGLSLSVLFLLMLVIGGTGSIAGSFLGPLLVTAGFELLRPFRDYQMIVYGVAVALVCVFLPAGLTGLWRLLPARGRHAA